MTGAACRADTAPMDRGWLERERRGLAGERRVLTWLGAGFGALAVGGFLVASLAALVAGAVGTTFVLGRMRSLEVAARLLSRR